MTVEDRNKFVKARKDVQTVQDLLQKLLHGYPEEIQNEYSRRWEEAEKARKELAKKERSAARPGWMEGTQRMKAKAMLRKCQT